MKTIIRIGVFLVVILFIWVYVLISGKETNPSQYVEPPSAKKELQDEETSLERPTIGLSTLIGKDTKEVVSLLGQPDRIDPSFYDYDWWVYQKNPTEYAQVGVEGDRVVTVFALGDDLNVAPFSIGQSLSEIYSEFQIYNDISFEYEGTSYQFELTDEDMNYRPLLKLGDGEVYAQLYLDKFSESLSSVRFLDQKTLVQHKPYEMMYRGPLYEAAERPSEEQKKAEDGASQQIFEMTNVLRIRNNVPMISWDEETSEVALSHSQEMVAEQFFAHDSPISGSLADRLETAEVFYEKAGENIAAEYVDAPATMEGWMNSRGHRETLLDESYTHLGVGVYQRYYTQNFIRKTWEDVQ
ncbi:CAP domain-containing protein [Bacillus fonticola]|uniref:CAP domain-containing protein n=1 Tax=Bacillus fonticola TaxID=2728853 RepID=UPI001475598D|nr:CAP domain-containing protein [Bacillus fonticola]